MPDTSSRADGPSQDPHCSSSLLRLLADSVPALLAYFESSTLRCVFANQGYAESTGHTVEAILGKTVQEAIGDSAWASIQPQIQQVLRGERVQYTRKQRVRGGPPRMIEVNLIPHLHPKLGLMGAFVLINDITHHWEAERAVRESEERMRKFSQATEEAIVFHREGLVTDFNEALTRLMGYSLAEVRGRRMLDFVSEEFRPVTEAYVREGREEPYEVTVLHRDGHAVPVEIVGKTMPWKGSDYRIAVLRDITARRQAQEREAFLARHDALTQLPNRATLMEQLTAVIESAQRTPQAAAVLFIDMDHFKTVNDSLGHEAGDMLLCEVARRLVQGVRSVDIVARVGGDEFVVVLRDAQDRPSALAVADQLLADVCAVFHADGTPLSVSVSIGVSMYPDDGDTAAELVRRADAAMQQAKDSGRANRQAYAPGMETPSTGVLQHERLLRDAILHGAFVLHYQPQVRLDDGALVGFEALVRWRHPERDLVGPIDFIAFAEARGLITPIGRWVLVEACRQMRAWHDEGLPQVPVAVNLSALEFRQRDVAGEIAGVLRQTGLAPRFLEIELTESVLMHEADQVRRTLDALKALGVRVSIDDFGTGYSSLAYLKRYPIDKLKIDRSFVSDTPANEDDVAIVTAIVQMGRSLQIQTVAEGVETAAQHDLLRTLGCHLAQGYLISPPMDPRQTREWLLKKR
ncbi:EAL domain-containing protein [Acidovorax sp. SUPP2539]|uniref:putative bifunctional diguanylate cyclase/phosphodiesterase n=1 Tax=Acidovorax sp. SUPP2539 TaxID=2920878 RepID=UPI0023DE326F|nr:EAL domain-containing protein [Acidovorax sp. SUPP2539]GKS87727.1 GGDEF domain-containing phosphodiesterase [Acidovorax sp. SUPP2539]